MVLFDSSRAFDPIGIFIIPTCRHLYDLSAHKALVICVWVSSNITTNNNCTHEKYPPRWKDLHVVVVHWAKVWDDWMQISWMQNLVSISLTTSLRVAPSGWERERYTQVVVQQVNNEGKWNQVDEARYISCWFSLSPTKSKKESKWILLCIVSGNWIWNENAPGVTFTISCPLVLINDGSFNGMTVDMMMRQRWWHAGSLVYPRIITK